MAQEIVLTVTDVAKCYRLYARPFDRFRELLGGKRRHQECWALQSVSFALHRGASLGVIGDNGAGKSTLLKLVTGVLTPTTGRVQRQGRVASIIELGMGFHTEFTGLENLFVGGALLGLSRRQVEAKIPEIEAFAELGPFLHRPLKSYSTGMGMRLAFALAVSVEPDVLIVDEALAVGDGYFQKKCVDRICAFQGRGGSLLFCSHSLYSVNLICHQALWLHGGQMQACGPTAQVIAAYEAHLHAKEAKLLEQPAHEHKPGGELREVYLEGGQRNGTSLSVRPGAEVVVRVRWRSDSPQRLFHLGVAIDRVDNLTCFATTTLKDGLPPFSGRRDYAATVSFPALPLTGGSFRAMIFLLDEHGVHLYDHRAAEPTLTIANAEKEWGICYLPHTWEPGEPAC